MTPMPYLRHRACAETATELMHNFGDAAEHEAAARAYKSRDVGNVVQFCRWRQIERLIAIMNNGGANVTVH